MRFPGRGGYRVGVAGFAVYDGGEGVVAGRVAVLADPGVAVAVPAGVPTADWKVTAPTIASTSLRWVPILSAEKRNRLFPCPTIQTAAATVFPFCIYVPSKVFAGSPPIGAKALVNEPRRSATPIPWLRCMLRLKAAISA